MVKCSNDGCEYEYCCIHCDRFGKDCTCEKIFNNERGQEAILKRCFYASKENRCIVCGDVIPEGRQVCPNCESMREKETIEELKPNKNFPFDDYVSEGARKLAIKALESQIKLKEYIERINQPEYKDVVWKKDEVVLLLQELVAK